MSHPLQRPRVALAVLVGNGLSIAFNSELTIPSIHREITKRLNAAGDATTTPAKIMQQVARNVGTGDPTSDFEAMLGPFDQYRDNLMMLRSLASLAGAHDAEIAEALRRSATFADDLRRFGVGHALEVIAERSVARWTDRVVIDDFVTAVVNASGGGRIDFGNLNYDALLMASLCALYGPDMCDMTDGRVAQALVDDVVPSCDLQMTGRPLRTTPNYPFNRRIRLLHLHGSLTWLRSPHADGTVHRFDIEPLRSAKYWAHWREGDSLWTPEVVLTNQSTKDTLVKDQPFSLAYDSFYERLLTADRWLIAGYSFRDGCVNDLLARAWAKRRDVPDVFVVTKGSSPSEEEVLTAIGWDPVNLGDPDPRDWLYFERHGIVDAPQSLAWASWETAPLQSNRIIQLPQPGLASVL